MPTAASFPRSPPCSSFADHRGSQVFVLSNALLALCSISVVSGQTGVFLSLNGVTIPNDGYVLAGDIGSGSTGLHCNTDSSYCCGRDDHPDRVTVQGRWYRPDITEVMGFGAENTAYPSGNFFFRDRGSGVIRLNSNGNPTDRGRFHCDIPDANGVTVTLYVNIVDMLPTTTTTSLPSEQPMTTTTQSVPPTTTESPVTTTTQSAPPTTTESPMTTTTQSPPATTIEQPVTTTLSQSTPPTTTQGVFLSLNGVTIPNDGYVIVSNIGMGDTGLHCNTDRSDCCRGSDNPSGGTQGRWYYPDGREVRDYTTEIVDDPNGNFFSRNRGTGIVRLNRNGNPPAADRGRLRCDIPNTSGVTVTLYVNIVDMPPITSPPTEPPIPLTTTTQSTPPTTSQGVFLSLNGVTIPNDDYVLANTIGSGGTSLHCNTDRSDCCQASGEGHWYLPNGNEVMSFTAEDNARPEPDNFFSRDRRTGVVRLSRHGNPPERGRFRCEIPNVNGVTVTLYVNIVDMLPPPTTIPPTTSVNIIPTTPEPATSTTPPETPTTPTTGGSYPSLAGEQLSSAPCTCSSEVGIAVGSLLLVEGIITGVITIIVVSCWIVMRQKKSGKSDFAVSANMAYGQVKLDTLGDVGGEYENPDRLARYGQSGGGNYEPTGQPAPYELPVSQSEAPVYATADDTTTSGKTQPT